MKKEFRGIIRKEIKRNEKGEFAGIRYIIDLDYLYEGCEEMMIDYKMKYLAEGLDLKLDDNLQKDINQYEEDGGI